MSLATTDLAANLAGSGVIAVIGGIAFMMLGRMWLRLSGKLRHRSVFAPAILQPPGHRYRLRLDTKRSQLHVALATLALLPLFFGAVLLAWPDELDANLAGWQWPLMAIIAIATVGYLLHQSVRLLFDCRQAQQQWLADVAVGHGLERVMRRGFAVFHDVAFDDVFAPKILVGTSGVFVLSLCVHPNHNRDAELPVNATFDGASLVFPDDKRVGEAALARKRAVAVARHLSRKLGKKIAACPVLVVPGWNLTCPVQPEFPIVNERNIDLLCGWTKPESHLMSEEAQVLEEHLSELCRDRRYR